VEANGLCRLSTKPEAVDDQIKTQHSTTPENLEEVRSTNSSGVRLGKKPGYKVDRVEAYCGKLRRSQLLHSGPVIERSEIIR
jgi:hypothetical protein